MASITEIKSEIKRMEAGKFQVLCDRFLAKEGLIPTSSLGMQAGTYKTTPGTPDTYIYMDNGKYIFVEYTTQQDNIVSKITDDLNKCFDIGKTGIPLDKIDKIYYFHTSSNIKPEDDMKLRGLCSSKKVSLVLIGIDTLAESLRKYPSIIKEELNLEIGTEQIQAVDEFIQQYNTAKTAAPLDTTFLFRTQEIEKLKMLFADKDAVILTGDAGVGKTRLALAYAQDHAKEHRETLLCIHDRSLSIYDDLIIALEQPGCYFFLIDDANQLSNLKLIVETITQKLTDYSFKLLITSRNYAAAKVKNEISDIVDYDVLQLEKLSDNEIKEIVKENLGIINTKYLDRIAVIAEGNARLAMLAGRLALKENCLSSINDVSSLYDVYFSSAFQEAKLSQERDMLISAGIVAFLDRIHLEHIDFLIPLLDSKGITQEQFILALYHLHDREIVDIYHDKAVKFADQCFANYILKHVFYDAKYILLREMIHCCFKTQRTRTIQAINTLANVFMKKEIHEYIEEEVRYVWKQMESGDGETFLDYVRAFYPLNRVETLVLLLEAIDNEKEVHLPIDEIDTKNGRNNEIIDNDIISILRGFSLTEEMDSSLDLFFRYYLKRPDLYMQFYHASIQAYGISIESMQSGFTSTMHFLTKMCEYSNAWKNDYIILLFLDIAENLLRFHFNPTVNNYRSQGLTICQIQLQSSEYTKQYRDLLWTYLENIVVEKKQLQKIRSLLEKYGYGADKESRDILMDEFDHVLEICKRILSVDSINDCILIKELSEFYSRFDISIEAFSQWLNSDKMFYYNLLAGPSYFEIRDYDARGKAQCAGIQEYMRTCPSKLNVVLKMLSIYQNLGEKKYSTNRGINTALQELGENESDFAQASRYILQNDLTFGIDIGYIIQKLFSFMTSIEVKQFITENAKSELDIWLYTYYCVIPEDQIDHNTVQDLFAFLKTENDDNYGGYAYRNLRFAEKYTKSDPMIYIHIISLIFAKREQSPRIVKCYLEYIFHEQFIENELMEVFKDHFDLLGDIYCYLWEKGCNPDHEGKYINLLQKSDPEFIKKLTYSLVLIVDSSHFHRDPDTRFMALYHSDNYIQIIDQIIEVSIKASKKPYSSVPEIIKLFLLHTDKQIDLIEKRDSWLIHYIEANAQDDDRMSYIFDAINDFPFNIRRKCIQTFTDHNQSIEAFQKISLLPTSYSATGSFVPVYTSFITFLSSLLPIFSGLRFVRHKQLIEEHIAKLKETIKREEINDILLG